MRFNELAKAVAGLLNRARSSANSNAQSSPNAGGPADDALQTIIDTIPALVVRRGADGKIDYVNRAWRDFTGLSGPESYDAAAIHPDDRPRVEQPWLSHLGKGEQFETEYRVRSANGEYRWLLVRRTPLRDSNGKVIAWYGVGYDIEDRKRAETALQTMIDTIPALVVRRGADGKIDYVNQTWCTFTGLSQGQPPEIYEAAAMHPDDRPRVDPPWREHLSKGESFETEYRVRRADGEYRWLSVHRTPLRDNNGKVIAWYGVGYDIEDKKRAENALRQSESNLAEAQKLSHTGSFSWNLTSGKIAWSAETFRIFEHEPAPNVTFDMVLDRVHPDDVALVHSVVDRAVAHKEAFDFEHRLLMPDGSIKHLHVVAQALFDDPQNLRFAGALMDVTAHREDEQSLRRSEERYRTLIHHLPVALLQVDSSRLGDIFDELKAKGVTDIAAHLDAHPDLIAFAGNAVRVIDVNQQAVSLFGGTSPSDFIGPIAFLFAVSKQSARRVMIAHFNGERTHAETTKIKTIDGRVRDVQLSVSYPVGHSKLDATLICVEDITDRLRTEGQLRQLQTEFAHAARISTLGELSSSIAHEVNQPLAAILTNAETSLRWLSREDPNITKVEQLTSRIVKNAQHASDIVKRIRGMATKNESEHTTLDLNEVVSDALLLIRHDIDSRSIDLNAVFDRQIPAVAGDRVQLQQVVINLLVNSIQAMSSPNVAQHQLDLRTSRDTDGCVVFSIHDSGTGIAEKDIDKVFESFFSTKNAGMGIGLAICRSIITAHGGSISVRNHPSGGAEFQFWLPAN
jgi:PAS domain S-box-containing protein